eukprot:3723040-Rhodomonas_salina.1
MRGWSSAQCAMQPRQTSARRHVSARDSAMHAAGHALLEWSKYGMIADMGIGCRMNGVEPARPSAPARPAPSAPAQPSPSSSAQTAPSPSPTPQTSAAAPAPLHAPPPSPAPSAASCRRSAPPAPSGSAVCPGPHTRLPCQSQPRPIAVPHRYKTDDLVEIPSERTDAREKQEGGTCIRRALSSRCSS